MADLHRKSTGSATAPYDTWATGLTTIAAAIAAMVAGDRLFLTNTETDAAAGVNITLPGTDAAPVYIIGGTEGTPSGLSAVAAGAVIESTNTTFTVNGTGFCDRITWRCSSASSFSANFAAATGAHQTHRDCKFEHTGAGATSSFTFGSATGAASSSVQLEAPTFRFGNAGQRINVNGALEIRGGGLDATSSAITALVGVGMTQRPTRLIVEDFDASPAANSLVVIANPGNSGTYARLRRIKMPGSWAGSLISSSANLKRGDRFELIDYSVGSTLHRLWVEDYAGQIKDESTIKVTANDLSYRMATSAACSVACPMRSHEYHVPLTGAGAQTITLDICTDGVTLTDAEACLEVSYFAASGSSLGTIVTDAAASSIATPANQATSSTTWTTTGLSSPVKQSLSVTITAGRASYAIVRAVLRKASTTVYLDDRVQVA